MKFNFSFLRNNFRFLSTMNSNFFSFKNLFEEMILEMIVLFLKESLSTKELFMTLATTFLQNFDLKQSDARLCYVKK